MEVTRKVRIQIVGHTSTDAHNIYSQGEWNNT
jgi:hypothetical protein